MTTTMAFTMQNLPQVQPCNWVCLDIETARGRADDANAWMRLHWNPNKNWTNETIGCRWREMHGKLIERLALLDAAPIIIVAWRSDRDLRLLHCMYPHEPRQQDGAIVEGFSDQPSMLVALRNLMDVNIDDQTLLVGHNIQAFDLPKLRWAFLRHGVRLPRALAAKDPPAFDSMKEYCRRFSLDRDIMIGLEDLLDTLGFDHHKGLVSGKNVPELYERGEYEILIRYALLDVLIEADLFLKMTGRAVGLR